MLTTTLTEILAHNPPGLDPDRNGSTHGWLRLLSGLGKTKADDEPLPLIRILELNGLNDAVWSAKTQPQNALIDLACRFAESVLHLTTNPIAADAITAARGVIAGTHTKRQARLAGYAAGYVSHIVHYPGNYSRSPSASDYAIEAASCATVTADCEPLPLGRYSYGNENAEATFHYAFDAADAAGELDTHMPKCIQIFTDWANQETP